MLFNFTAISNLWEYVYGKKKGKRFWSLMCECWVLHRVFAISEWMFAKLLWKKCGALKYQLFLLWSSQVCGYDLQCCDVFCLPSRLLLVFMNECLYSMTGLLKHTCTGTSVRFSFLKASICITYISYGWYMEY